MSHLNTVTSIELSDKILENSITCFSISICPERTVIASEAVGYICHCWRYKAQVGRGITPLRFGVSKNSLFTPLNVGTKSKCCEHSDQG